MTILVDTNVLLRSIQPGHPQHGEAATIVKTLEASGHDLALVPQVIYEFWVVATRPVARNGLGLPPSSVELEVAHLRQVRNLLHDDQFVFHAWLALMSKYAVLGKPAHDARLVAAMVRHGVTHLLTFNGADFARYAEITAVPPADAAALPPASG